ncbi:VanZ family protein [Candidatus Acetothermia bacterium]|jgi:hypothetical protein|nr:VanZ family protein [Candidatus Acetothermia bacterium]MCI2435706.1 VanZ family protein [Candidatus Acetothermia bacterium]
MNAYTVVRGLWWTLFLGYALLIFWLSHGPIPEGVPFIREIPGFDKLYHALQYALLGFLGLQAFMPRTRAQFLRVLLLCWFYGLTDELHQAFVPGRGADLIDWLADGLGVGLAGWGWARWRGVDLNLKELFRAPPAP